MSNPLVTIGCITYNHEKYISEAIESFLMQKTDFEYEIIIHDDASTDSTPEILKSYKEKYPDKIRLILQEENQWSKGGGSVYRRFVFPVARGKYIALCEGDDYWIDPYKITKQVKVFEENNSCTLVHTGYDRLYQETGKIVKHNPKYSKEKYLDNINPVVERMLDKSYTIMTLTTMIRASVFEDVSPTAHSNIKVGDLIFWYFCLLKGEIKYLNESTGVYRANIGSVANPKKMSDKVRFRLNAVEVRKLYANTFNLQNKMTDILEYENRLLIELYFYESNYLLAKESYDKLRKKDKKMTLLLMGSRFKLFKRFLLFAMNYKNNNKSIVFA